RPFSGKKSERLSFRSRWRTNQPNVPVFITLVLFFKVVGIDKMIMKSQRSFPGLATMTRARKRDVLYQQEKTEPAEAMAALTLAYVQVLLDQFKGEGLMVSCYADLSIERRFPSRWSGPFKAKAGALKKALADDRRAWQGCAQDLEAIQRVLEAPEARQAQG